MGERGKDRGKLPGRRGPYNMSQALIGREDKVESF